MINKNAFLFILFVLYTFSLLYAEVHHKMEHSNKNIVVTLTQKKQHFYALLLPAINSVYDDLEKKYLEVSQLIARDPKNKKIQLLMQRYHAASLNDLLRRMKPHPKSIAIAQSAIESAWATSRFFKVANNIFGVWSFNKNEPRIAASKKRGSKTIYLKKYATLKDSVRDYYNIIATRKAFRKFRKEKMRTDNPYKLVKYLNKYSEQGQQYTRSLAKIIYSEKLTKYDN